MRKFWPIFSFFILLGLVAIALNTIFGYGTITFVERTRIQDIWVYKYNVWPYLSEIKNSFQTTARLELTWQTRAWNNAGDWNALINNLAYILNVIIFGLNVILYPIRIGAYALTIIGSVLGLPVLTYKPENNLAWLFKTIEFLTSLQIPYV